MKALLIGSALLALAVPALAQVAQPAPAASAPRAQQVQSRADVQARVATHFARLDINRDGFVTKVEADAARQAMRGKMRERLIERREKHGAAAFERLDSNRDGAISRQEWDAGRAMREQRIVIRREGGHGKGMRRGGGPGGLGGRMFEMADADKDGRVSLAEAQAAALRRFDMMDTNRDGRITPDERGGMRHRMGLDQRG